MTYQERGPGPKTAPPLVGREREVASIADALDAARSGLGAIVLLSGEPGIGKSRLLREAEWLGAARGMPVVWGRAAESEGAPPYWPWDQVLRALPGSRPGAGSVAGLPREDRFALFEGVARLLRDAARDSGLVVLLDDLHWADPPSLKLLEHVGLGWSDVHALIVAAHRQPVQARDDPLRQALAALSRLERTTRLELRGLTAEGVAEQLAAVSGRRLAPTAVRDVLRRTGGNPFFVREFGRLVDEAGGQLPVDVGRAIPGGVRDVIARRLSSLSPVCQEALEVAAVAGAEPQLAAALTGRPLPSVLDALDEAVTAGLLMRGGGLTYAFTHALVQETVHDELGTSRRVALHAATAAELERSGAADVEQGSSELAYHWLEAAPAGHAAHAAHAAERAARSASQQLAYEESARLYEAAAAVVPPDRSRASRPAWLLIESARMRFVAGELDRAASLCERAAEMARNTEDAELLAAAALVIEGVGDASLSAMIGRLCEEALAAAPAVPEVTRSRLLSQLVTARMYLGDYASLEPLSREALDAAERIGDADALVAALRARHIAFSGPDGLDERVRIADRMLLLAQALDRRVDEVWARLWRFDAAVALGRLDDAGAEVDAVARLAQPMRNPLLLWHLSRCRFALAHACGDFDAAVRAAEDGDRFARSAGQLAGERRHMQRVILAVSTGEDCEDDITAIRLAREGDRGQRTSAPMLLHELTVALLALARGDAERAAALLDSMPPPESWRIMPPARLVTLRHHATLLAALGRREACASMQQQLLPYADQFATSGAGTVASFGSVELTLGSLAAALDRADRAVQHLERALERNAGTGMRPAAEEARFELAKTLFQRDRGTDRGRALQLAAECEKRAGALGMRLLAARAAELRAQLRAGTRRERLLTPREVEVARLVAEGLTSREIAEAMHISARTADNHVQHILDKLGLRSRSQVAAWVARRA